MNTLLFVAFAERTEAGGYRATFADVSECATDGRDLTELLINARQALAGRLRELAEAGESWPQPTPFESLAAEPGVIPILVDVAVDDPPVRVNISLGERLVGRLDAAAEARGMTRSGFIAQAVRVSLGERGATADFDAATRRLLDELRTLGRRINESIGPDSAFNRRMADWDDQFVEGVRKAADSVSAAMKRRRKASHSGRPTDRASVASES
jgi:predicted RNase H-like HicB family nuclease